MSRLRILRLLLGLSLVGGWLTASSCSITPDKRLLQYLNTEGFGHRYVGNALEENYVSIRDSFRWIDTLDTTGTRGGSAIVEIDGTVYLPEVGTVHVAGMTRTQIEALLTQKFSAYYNETDVEVEELSTSSQKIYYIFGEVGSQGRQTLNADLTLFDVVWQANPDPVRGNLGRVRLIRADPVSPTILVCNLRDLLNYGDSTYNPRIQERDIIVVPPTFLAQLGSFLSALISPITTVFNSVFQGLNGLNRGANFGGGGFGGGGFGNNNNNGFNLF